MSISNLLANDTKAAYKDINANQVNLNKEVVNQDFGASPDAVITGLASSAQVNYTNSPIIPNGDWSTSMFLVFSAYTDLTDKTIMIQYFGNNNSEKLHTIDLSRVGNRVEVRFFNSDPAPATVTSRSLKVLIF